MNILSDEFNEDVANKLKITNIDLDVYENVGIQHFYHTLLTKSKRDMIRLSEMMDKEYQELYNYYKFEYSKTLKGSEIEIWIKNNDKFKKINNLFQLKKLEIEVLEETVKLFKDRGWSIKSAIELIKLERV